MYQAQYTLYVSIHHVYMLDIERECCLLVLNLVSSTLPCITVVSDLEGSDNGDPLYGIIYCR
jgi:hypothetical protein